MFVTVCLHSVETVIGPATPGFVSGNTVKIVEDNGKGWWNSIASKECIDILQCRVSHVRVNIPACIYECIYKFQAFRVEIFRLLNPLKGNVSLALVTSTKSLYIFGSQPVVWCLRLVKTVTKNVVPKFHTFMKATCPLPSFECTFLESKIPFSVISIFGSEDSERSSGERSCITFRIYWKTRSSNDYIN